MSAEEGRVVIWRGGRRPFVGRRRIDIEARRGAIQGVHSCFASGAFRSCPFAPRYESACLQRGMAVGGSRPFRAKSGASIRKRHTNQ